MEHHRLGELITTLKGFAFKSSWYSDSGIGLVKATNFTDDSIDFQSLSFIEKDIGKDYIKYELKSGDILVQTVGSWPRNPKSVVGKVVRVPRDVEGSLLNQNIVKIMPTERINKNYLYYLLKTKRFKDYIINTAQGAANQASITLESIKKFEFELPIVNEQKIIGEIIKKYDDLIKINQRRITILENMASLIFDEWFVKLKFPVHRTTKFIDDKLGKKPSNWNLEKIKDHCDFIRGIEPGSKNYVEKKESNNINFIRVGDFGSRGSNIFVDIELIGDKVLSPDDVAVTLDGTVGLVKFGMSGGYSSGIRKLVMKNTTISWAYIYFLLKSTRIQKIIKAHAKGTTILHAASSIDYMNFYLPDDVTLKEFDSICTPMLQEVISLDKKNLYLIKMRDSLINSILLKDYNLSSVFSKLLEVEA